MYIAARPQSTPLGQASSPKRLVCAKLSAWQCLGHSLALQAHCANGNNSKDAQ